VAAAFEPARRLVGLRGREEPAAAKAEEHYSLRRLRVQPPHTLVLSSFVTRREGRGGEVDHRAYGEYPRRQVDRAADGDGVEGTRALRSPRVANFG
jgi:hypothetical protein